MALYGMRTIDQLHYRCVKLGYDLNVEAIYILTVKGRTVGCSCPGGRRPECKHRAMWTQFVLSERLDKGFFIDDILSEWVTPCST